MNIDKIHYLSFDLDGTLLNKDGKLTPYTKEIVKRLQEKGYVVILNSGRFYHELEQFCEQLELKKYGGYAISSNGYRMYDIKKDIVSCNPGISVQESKSLFQVIQKHQIFTFLHYDDHYCMYTRRITGAFLKLAQAIAKISLPYPKIMLRYIGLFRKVEFRQYQHHDITQELEKMCFIGLPFSIHRVVQHIEQRHEDYQFFRVNSCSTELVKKGVSKADAVRLIVSKQGHDLHNVIAFGDAGNDVPLLQQAGIGVCMKNSKSGITQHSPHITSYTNDEDGVAKYLESMFL